VYQRRRDGSANLWVPWCPSVKETGASVTDCNLSALRCRWVIRLRCGAWRGY